VLSIKEGATGERSEFFKIGIGRRNSGERSAAQIAGVTGVYACTVAFI